MNDRAAAGGDSRDRWSEQVLAFRLARAGLTARTARSLAEATACPASDFSRDAALLALAARSDEISREAYDAAVDTGEVVVAYVIRGAIHALAPEDFGLYGQALIGRDGPELEAQLGRGNAGGAELEEVTAATRDALAGGRALNKNELHEALRERLGPELLPWCRGCKSHHVAPMLWRFATRKAGVRLDSQRRYRSGDPGPAPAASEAARRFLRFYGPAGPVEFAEWAGLTPAHAQRLWDEVTADLTEVDGHGWLLREDLRALESAPAPTGLRLLPPGDPYLQKANRRLLVPDPGLRRRLFRPVASPGAVLQDGRLAGLWRTTRAQITVEPLVRLRRPELEEEVRRVTRLRGNAEAALVIG